MYKCDQASPLELGGDTSQLDPKEKKLLAELDEGGEEYYDKSFWEKVVAGAKRKLKVEEVSEVPDVPVAPGVPEVQAEEALEPKLEPRPKKQRLITDYNHQVIKADKGQSPPMVVEKVDLKDKLLEPEMVKKGAKAMQRALKKRREARDRYLKYTSQYEYLSISGNKDMCKAWRESNKLRENWMELRRPEVIPEEEEPPEDPPEPPKETPGPEPTGVPEANPERGKGSKIIDYYNKLGKSKTPRTTSSPKTPGKSTSSSPSRGVTKTIRKGKPKLEEPQRLKLELAMRNFLLKKPPDK